MTCPHRCRILIEKATRRVYGTLRVLFKMSQTKKNFALRLIASADDLELLARDDNAPIRALAGWRREVFGAAALKLKNGEMALAVKNGRFV
ncbi:MAG: hypothetical protein CM15mP46_7090 [Alphaproteobacteria bacterium]|nr:MAG: hypothetical protein CM15mP46_7090 [Alphaproteobacteria bacterium]